MAEPNEMQKPVCKKWCAVFPVSDFLQRQDGNKAAAHQLTQEKNELEGKTVGGKIQ